MYSYKERDSTNIQLLVTFQRCQNLPFGSYLYEMYKCKRANVSLRSFKVLSDPNQYFLIIISFVSSIPNVIIYYVMCELYNPHNYVLNKNWLHFRIHVSL